MGMLNRIDALIEKGYQLKASRPFGQILLIDNKGKSILTYGFFSPLKADSRIGLSLIAFLFGPFLATRIRDWSYFWFLGIVFIIFQSLNLIFPNLNLEYIPLIFATCYYYSYYYPLKRWVFRNRNKIQTPWLLSIILTFVLLLIALFPGLLIY